MTHPMFVEKTYRPKFARQNFIKAEKFARQNSYFQALGGVTPLPRSYVPARLKKFVESCRAQSVEAYYQDSNKRVKIEQKRGLIYHVIRHEST